MKELEFFKKLDLLKIYMHYWIENRAINMLFPDTSEVFTYTFEDFLITKSKQTEMTLVDEWQWKHNIL